MGQDEVQDKTKIEGDAQHRASRARAATGKNDLPLSSC